LVEQISENTQAIIDETTIRTAAVIDLEARISGLEENTISTEELKHHLDNKANPHNVTAAQVGLGHVSNLPMDQIPTVGSINYITSGAVSKVETTLTNNITDHKNDNDNPHNITATQVGLGLVENKSMDEVPSNTDNYVKSKGVKAAIESVQSSLTSHMTKTEGNANPHNVTKNQLGLENVLNVASYSKTEEDNLLEAKEGECVIKRACI
jgi:hypothetical protein